MAPYVIVYAFDEPPGAALAKTFRLADRLYLVHGDERPDLWVSRSDFRQVEAVLAAALAAGQVRSAALLPTVPPPQQRWMLTEWDGQLAVHSTLAHQLDPQCWTGSSSYELVELRVFLPSPAEPDRVITSSLIRPRHPRPVWVETVAEYRASLESEQPTLITAPVEQIVTRKRDWFGPLADVRVGGAIAILAMSGVTASARTQVVLRNPSALGMRLVTDRTALAAQCRAGRIAVRAWGTSRDDLTRLARTPGRTRRESRSLAAGLTAMKDATGASYGVLTEFLATEVDTEVLIHDGLVFEQETLNGVQNLAIAAESVVTVEIAAGRPVTTAQPAWCLNRYLAPPTGQAMRPTSLRVPLAAGLDQGTVWDLVERSLHSFGIQA